jgi:2-desacetyl-2-hydroxyethyl bacteriochlorophyllide A dehydrogenase
MMRALVCTGPRKFEYRDWPDPELGAGDALVKVRSVGVCGSDLRAWSVSSKRRVPPFILGHELAGEVVEVRDSQANLRAGDRVVIYPLAGCNHCRSCDSGRDYLCPNRRELGLQLAGAFAEYLRIPARNLYLLPDGMEWLQGALVEPLSVALHMVARAGEGTGPAAILGAGPIGLLVLHVARVSGFPRIAVAEVNGHRSRTATSFGAELVVNPRDPESMEQLQQFFRTDGCAVVFDAAGFSATRQMALKLVRAGGTVVLAGGGEAETSLEFVDVICREVRLQGSFAYSRQDFEMALQWIAAGRLKLEQWVSEAGLDEGQRIFEELSDPNPERIKVVLRP